MSGVCLLFIRSLFRGRSRLRPVLMTTLTTILGMVPMAIGGGEGSEMWQPLGVSVIGGLTVSTVLTLIFGSGALTVHLRVQVSSVTVRR